MSMNEESKAVYVGVGFLKAADMADEMGTSLLNSRDDGRERAKLFHDFADRLRSAAAGERYEAKRRERARA